MPNHFIKFPPEARPGGICYFMTDNNQEETGKTWMKGKTEYTNCPHCNSKLFPWMPPVDSSWGENLQYVCFDDDCEYYTRGWNHMWENYKAKSSYRFRYDPTTGETGPLPVWSENAHKDRITL